jgi:Telomeric repeat-binding factor 2.
MFKKILYLSLISILFLVSLFACSGQTTASGSAGTQPSGSAPAQAAQTTQENEAAGSTSPAPTLKDIYQIGEVANVNGAQFQVSKMEKSAGGEYDKPKSGNEFVVVTVNIKNAGQENVDYNPFYFTMQNSQGQISNGTISMDNTKTALSSGQLTPGGFVSGTVIFEEPKNDKALKLIYKPLLPGTETVVNFDLMNALKQFDPLTGDQTAQAASSSAYKVGDVGQLGGCNVQVSKVQKSSGSEFEKPKTGNEFVIVTVNIKNSGNDKISYNPLYFTMKNSKGQIENQIISTIDTDTALSSGDLAPGGLVSGTIVFEQPKGDTGLELIFEENMFSDKTISFNLNEKLDTITPLK